jgi:hypothetical protein
LVSEDEEHSWDEIKDLLKPIRKQLTYKVMTFIKSAIQKVQVDLP